MDYIIKNGIGSKNTALNTEKGISLALSNKDLSGISLNLNMTKDHQIVIATGDTLKKFPNIKIKDSTLRQLKNYNIGTRVNPEQIMTLEETLHQFQNDLKSFIFTMGEHGKDNKRFVEEVTKIINKYPNSNLYLKSSSSEIVLYLREFAQFAKIGAILIDTSPYFLKQQLDFYSLAGPSLCPYWSKQKSEEKTLLMVENVMNEDEAIDTIQETKDFLKKMYMIVNDIDIFNSIYDPCQKELETIEGINKTN